MRKKYKHLEALFGGKVPDARTFNQSLSAMPAAEREHVVNCIISLGFTAWTELSPKHKDFIVAVIEHERQPIVDFCNQKTVLGRLPYPENLPEPSGNGNTNQLPYPPESILIRQLPGRSDAGYGRSNGVAGEGTGDGCL